MNLNLNMKIGIAVICLLLAVNFLLLTNNYKCVKYGDLNAQICGPNNPVTSIQSAIKNSKKVVLVAEAEYGAADINRNISNSLLLISDDFGGKNVTIHALQFKDGKPFACVSEELETCINIDAPQDTIVVTLRYPTNSKNEIVLYGNRIDLKAVSSDDLYALVQMVFDNYILGV